MPENEGEPKTEISDLHTARLAALLDFYSDRATAHASLFVAFIFGLFALLAIIQNLQGLVVWFSILVYFALVYGGYFTLVRFGYYAGIANELTQTLESPLREQKKDSKKLSKLFDYIEEHKERQRQILVTKRFVRRFFRKKEAKATNYLYAFLYWGLTFLIGLIVYSKFLNNWIKWFWGIALFLVLGALFVYLPLKYPTKES